MTKPGLLNEQQAVVITDLRQVTTAWLTKVLTKSGALTAGQVAGFTVSSGQGNWSANAQLQVRYADGSLGSLPPRLFLKIVNTDLGDEFFGPSEVTYYTRDYVDVPTAPLIRCFDAASSEEKHYYHVLLQDVSDTHVRAADKEPTLEYGLVLAEGLAAMHVRWWGAERLAQAGAPMHGAAHLRRFVDIAEPGVGHILNQFSAELEPHWGATMRELYAKHPQTLLERMRDANGFTLVHGDAGQTNIMVPRRGDRPIYIIDRQPFDWSLTTWLGVYDLVYAMVLDWEIETRRRFEIPVLTHYHEHLARNGINNYSWEQLYADYRLCMPMGVYVATEYCREGINEPLTPIWLRMLKRSLTAIDDLNCQALW